MAPLDPIAPPLPDADGRAHGPLDAAARWRYELERAQLHLRTGRPTGGTESKAGAPESETASAAPQVVSDRTGIPEAPQGRAGGNGTPATDAGKTFSSETQPGPARGEGKPAGFAIEPLQPREDGGARMPASIGRALRPLRVIWPRVNVHAALQEGEAQVWVRDASIAPEERRQLAAEVAARLRAAGLRPGRLYLNGEEILNFVEGGGSWR
jgi:hypothetical protein